MMTNEQKSRILAAIAENRKNYASDAKHAVALGVSTSVYSNIKKGDTDRKLSDAGWVSIARRLGVSLSGEKEWQIVKTPVFEYVTTQLALCREQGLSGIICDLPDIGKTVAARWFAQNTPNTVYVDCSQVKTRPRLIRHIARQFGVTSTGRYIDVYDDLVYYLRSLDRPMIILDEAGDLSYEAYLELKALWNATEHHCGWYQLGADALRAKIDRGIEYAKVGYAELKSRFGNVYQRISPTDSKERESFMMTQAAMIAKANAGNDINVKEIVRKSGGSLRRVYTALNKQ